MLKHIYRRYKEISGWFLCEFDLEELQILVRSQKQISFVQIETSFLCEIGCGDGARVICLSAHVMQQLGLWNQKVQVNVDY